MKIKEKIRNHGLLGLGIAASLYGFHWISALDDYANSLMYVHPLKQDAVYEASAVLFGDVQMTRSLRKKSNVSRLEDNVFEEVIVIQTESSTHTLVDSDPYRNPYVNIDQVWLMGHSRPIEQKKSGELLYDTRRITEGNAREIMRLMKELFQHLPHDLDLWRKHAALTAPTT